MKLSLATAIAVVLGIAGIAFGDTLELKDGAVIKNCYVKDEGIRLLVWKNVDAAGTSDFTVIPRTSLARRLSEDAPTFNNKGEKIMTRQNPAIFRDEAWDAHPDKQDLSVIFIEMNPKLAGLHGKLFYSPDDFFTMKPDYKSFTGGVDIGEDNFLEPEKVVQNLKLKYEPGEEITLTANVRNFGFKPSEPFYYMWFIDGKRVAEGKCEEKLPVMGRTSFDYKYKWQDGQHTVTFKIDPGRPEIATINNELTDALWGLGFIYIVSDGRCKAWHEFRSAYGTFSFEDFYRWHVDIMNLLFQASRYPSCPDGIRARVRLDRIIYDDNPNDNKDKLRFSDDGIAYDQGAWTWDNRADEQETGVYYQTDPVWRNRTEWSLPHELGHQLGLTDWYWLDEPGVDCHVWPDTGEKVTHFQRHPYAMMHWHGPSVYNEVDAGYLNQNWNKPRGYFAEHAFAIPDENFLKVVDINGRGVPGASVEIFQRGVIPDMKKAPGEDHGVTYYQVDTAKGMNNPVPENPVIVGKTDDFGVIRLPNRPVKEVVSLNGFHRKNNPWWCADPGRPGLMLVKVTKGDNPQYFWLEYFQFNVAWFRGHKDKFEVALRTPYGSPDSPPAPKNVKAENIDATHVKVTWEWDAPDIMDSTYLNKVIGFKVYRRLSNEGLNDRPWFVEDTLGPGAREYVIDITERPEDMYFYGVQGGIRARYGVTSLGEISVESGIVEAPPLTEKKD